MADKTPQKTEFFRIAVEGQTATDGREITRQIIEECVKTFNRDTYGVRINMEHLRGFDPNGPFGMYGDVLELRHQEDDIQIGEQTEKRLALYAQLDPTPELVELNRKRQKIYTSIEPQPNFGGTGMFGLVGLALGFERRIVGPLAGLFLDRALQLLALAFQLLRGAFGLGLRIGALLLQLAGGLVQIAFHLVDQFAHDGIPSSG